MPLVSRTPTSRRAAGGAQPKAQERVGRPHTPACRLARKASPSPAAMLQRMMCGADSAVKGESKGPTPIGAPGGEALKALQSSLEQVMEERSELSSKNNELVASPDAEHRAHLRLCSVCPARPLRSARIHFVLTLCRRLSFGESAGH